MAANSVHQAKTVFSVPRESFMELIVCNKDLSKKDYRVCLLLLTYLNGFWRGTGRIEDPGNYRSISFSQMADTLGYSKSEVKECVNHLLDMRILEEDNSCTVKNGYRFRF